MKPKTLILFLVLSLSFCQANGQKDIEYTFSNEVTDSIQSAVRFYERAYKKPGNKLFMYALIETRDTCLAIYIVEFSNGYDTGIGELVRRSNRYLNAGPKLRVPIIFPEDLYSSFVKRDNIAYLPYGGQYIEVQIDKGQERVTKTARLF